MVRKSPSDIELRERIVVILLQTGYDAATVTDRAKVIEAYVQGDTEAVAGSVQQ